MNEFGQKNVVPLAERLSLSPEEASALTGIGLTSIRQAAADGGLKARKHGTRTIILPDDPKEWLKALPLIDKNGKRRGVNPGETTSLILAILTCTLGHLFAVFIPAMLLPIATPETFRHERRFVARLMPLTRPGLG
jgi:hypothetical protein